MLRVTCPPRPGARHLVVLALLGAGFCGALATLAGAPASTLPTSEEKTLIEKCLLPLPTKVQVAVAVVQGDSVRFLGAEKTPGRIRTIETVRRSSRSAPSPSSSRRRSWLSRWSKER